MKRLLLLLSIALLTVALFVESTTQTHQNLTDEESQLIRDCLAILIARNSSASYIPSSPVEIELIELLTDFRKQEMSIRFLEEQFAHGYTPSMEIMLAEKVHKAREEHNELKVSIINLVRQENERSAYNAFAVLSLTEK